MWRTWCVYFCIAYLFIIFLYRPLMRETPKLPKFSPIYMCIVRCAIYDHQMLKTRHFEHEYAFFGSEPCSAKCRGSKVLPPGKRSVAPLARYFIGQTKHKHQSGVIDIFPKLKMAVAAILDFQVMRIWPFRCVDSVAFVFCTKFRSNICYSHWDRRTYA